MRNNVTDIQVSTIWCFCHNWSGTFQIKAPHTSRSPSELAPSLLLSKDLGLCCSSSDLFTLMLYCEPTDMAHGTLQGTLHASSNTFSPPDHALGIYLCFYYTQFDFTKLAVWYSLSERKKHSLVHWLLFSSSSLGVQTTLH